MKPKPLILLFFCCATIFSACKQEPAQRNFSEHKQLNSIYYWKTVFRLNSSERQFLTKHKIGRIYIRFFDVATEDGYSEYYSTIKPVATAIFKETPPKNIEIIPTIFITNDAMKSQSFDSTTVHKIALRIFTMIETNDIPNVKEIQIDCDWSQSTQDKYFAFLDTLKHILHKKNIALSTTIRLHQFSLPVPPVDRGILMCYNTGQLKNNESLNSIINTSDVKPYIKKIQNYDLPMDIAYPAFSWAIWFREKEFQGILRLTDKPDSLYALKKNNLYSVTQGHYADGKYLAPNDEIRFEESNVNEIVNVKRMLDNKFKQPSIILYHLDSANLSKYQSHEIDEIYKH